MRAPEFKSDTTHPAIGLRTRVVRAGFWVFALRIMSQVFGLARTIVLARLLIPADFGLFGMVLLAMSVINTFTQTGVNAALIQKQKDTSPYLDTAWTVQVIRGIILALIAFAIAPYVASFFGVPAAKLVLQVIAFSVFLEGFGNIGVVYFQKELEFNKQFAYQISGTIADVGVAISAAVLLRSVWALVLGLLAGNLVRTVVSYFIHPYRPRLSFDLQRFKELFGFGKWFFCSSILQFLITQGDDILVGKLLGVRALGFYQLAYKLSNLPAIEIAHATSRVTFPAYSKLQDNLPRLREAYLRVLQLTAFLSFAIAGLILVLASDFTRIVLGENWMPMVPTVQALCIFGMIRSISATAGPIFYSVGKPKIQTRLSAIQLAIMAMIIYPLTIRWGILGASFAVVISSIVALILISREVSRIIDASYKELFMRIIVPSTAGVAVVCTGLLIQNLLTSINNVYRFLITAFLCGVYCFAVLCVWNRGRGYGVLHQIREIVANLGQR